MQVNREKSGRVAPDMDRLALGKFAAPEPRKIRLALTRSS